MQNKVSFIEAAELAAKSLITGERAEILEILGEILTKLNETGKLSHKSLLSLRESAWENIGSSLG